MGLFDKKYCDICGNKIGLLGNNKLADGNMCNECEKKLSNWFKDRKSSTLDQIRAQLAYREENARLLANFKPTREIGISGDNFFLIDENMGRFVILREGENMDKNPDLLEISKVTNACLEIKEETSEVKRKNPDGNMVSYNPKHYSYKYRFNITIDYNGEFFRQIKFALSSIAVNGGADDDNYQGMTLGESLKEEFKSQMGLADSYRPAPAVVRVNSRGVRNDLPGGYRTDGLTTMTEFDIQKYTEYEMAGTAIVNALLRRDGASFTAAAPTGQTAQSSSSDVSSMSTEELIRKGSELVSQNREEEAEPYLLRLAELGDETGTSFYKVSLLKRINKAASDDETIELYKKLVAYDPNEYTGMLLIMQQKLMAGSSEAGARDMLEWAEKAKAAGQDADNFIRFANMSLTASRSGLQDGATQTEQITAALMAAQTAAMETARANAAAQAQGGNDGWVCSCGAHNTGRFCGECGASRP